MKMKRKEKTANTLNRISGQTVAILSPSSSLYLCHAHYTLLRLSTAVCLSVSVCLNSKRNLNITWSSKSFFFQFLLSLVAVYEHWTVCVCVCSADAFNWNALLFRVCFFSLAILFFTSATYVVLFSTKRTANSFCKIHKIKTTAQLTKSQFRRNANTRTPLFTSSSSNWRAKKQIHNSHATTIGYRERAKKRQPLFRESTMNWFCFSLMLLRRKERKKIEGKSGKSPTNYKRFWLKWLQPIKKHTHDLHR